MAFGRRKGGADTSDAGTGDGSVSVEQEVDGTVSTNDVSATAVPPAAAQRIQRLAAEEQQDSSAFTSDLSVNEHFLVAQLGFVPVGYVMGTSIYHVGIQVARWSQSQELTTLSAAMYNARELALGRMRAEANALGADGIVGVSLDIRMYAWGQDVLEFVAEGTAVRSTTNAGAYRSGDGGPFTSDLSGQDFYTMVKTGHFPVAFVLGTCVYHVAHQGMMQALRQVGQNMEMPQFTEAVYSARELAMTRMQAEADRFGASGIVGVRSGVANHVWGEHATEFLAIGTAVRQIDAAGPPEFITLPISG
jgi:uncharacterized protein YbjQ (UPF0145 family)